MSAAIWGLLWQASCETLYMIGVSGLLACLDAIGEKLAATFPPPHQDNHLPDAPVVLAEP